MLKKCNCFLLFFSIMLLQPAYVLLAQNKPLYETISTAQGLSQGMIFDIIQDKEGFLWIATKNGLNRYDGYTFKIFTNDPYNSNSLSGNTILKLFEDSKGRIWVGTENAGVNIYDKKSGRFYRILHQAKDSGSLSGNTIRAIEELTDGRILVATDIAGLNIVQLPGDLFEKNSSPVITRLTLPNNTQVYGMGKDSTGTMWIGGMDGSVHRFDASNKGFTKLDNSILLYNGYLNEDGSKLINGNILLLHDQQVTPLFDIRKTAAGNLVFKPISDSLWNNFHRENGFYAIYKWMPGKAVDWNHPIPPGLIRLCYPFIIDRSGIVWSGSVGYGLRKYNKPGSKFKVLAPGVSVRWIVPVAANDILLADFSYEWWKLTSDSTRPGALKNIAVPQIDNFIVSSSGDYWIKSDIKGYCRYRPSTGELKLYPQIGDDKSIGTKQPMLEDSKGNIWFPGLGGKFTRYNPISEKTDHLNINTDAARPMHPKAICTALYEDKAGSTWIGTQEGFAKLRFSNAANVNPEIKWYYNNNNNRNSLNYNNVSSFMDDPVLPEKYLWISTKGGGLNRLDKTTGDFFHLTSKEGLPDDVLYGILSDDAGNIWGSTNKGIFCLLSVSGNNDHKWVFRNFTKADGLQDDEFNTGAYKKLPAGWLAFGGVNGLNIFDPKEMLSAGFTPNVFITDILVNNKPVQPADDDAVLQNTIEQSKNITLHYQQDILTLEFSSLDLTTPSQNKYRYQLVGIDKDWVESGTRRSATYLHLPAGSYTFKVQGSNSQGIWSPNTRELHITVLPPWWFTWWAYCVYILLLALVTRAFFKFYINRAKLRSQLNFEQMEAKRAKELDALKTQLYTNITHEFRTPLTVILGMSQQVISKPKENFDNRMSMIVRNGEHLLNLVNEMLDLSKLETGKMQLQQTEGDIINFLRYIIESFHSLGESQQKQLHFLTDMDALYMAYDPEKTRQILSNLLSNALKFTPEKGNIYVSVTENVQTLKSSRLIIKVKDTGIGIPEDQLENIFDRFYQLDNSHTRKTEGTGIGLALTKELVKLMGGDITVKSPAPGAIRGTEFTVTLPLIKAAVIPYDFKEIHAEQVTGKNSAPLTANTINTVTNKQAPLILLVEDNADVVAYTASCLPDYRLAVGKDGREGIEIAKEMIPDLIITDLMMPFVDGFELCRQLRGDEHTSHIPIIMLTAKAGMDSKIHGLEQGADAYLEKPFHKEELLIRIKKLLEMRQNLQRYYLNKAGLVQPATQTTTSEADDAGKVKNEDAFIKKVREAVETNIGNTEFTVQQLCRLVFMSHSQLHRKLDAVTGCSPNKFIRIIRLNKAIQLLKDPALSIAGIALDCGFNDPGYFARVFKQDYGVTPQEWRSKN